MTAGARRAFAFLVTVALAVAPGDGRARAAPAPCLRPPVVAPVIDPFRAPSCPYCAGNRGLEYGPSAGSPVVAAAAGTVSFAGTVAGVRYVVVDHPNGWRTTYGKLATIGVRTGSVVSVGDAVGTTTEAFFFGLRDGDTYVDPAPRIARIVVAPQLVPLDGVNRRPPRPGRVVCPQAVAQPTIR